MKCEKEYCLNESVEDRIFCVAHAKSVGKYGIQNRIRSEKETVTSSSENAGGTSLIAFEQKHQNRDEKLRSENDRPITQTSKLLEKEVQLKKEASPNPQGNGNLKHGWNDEEEIERLKTQPIGSGMQEIENKNYTKSANAERNAPHGSGYPEQQTSLVEARSRSMNLIDESTTVLLDCMKSAAKTASTQKVADFQTLNAIANLGKQIGQLARVKLDAIRESKR